MCSDDGPTIILDKLGDDCSPIIRYKSIKGCPVFTFDKFTAFIYEYKFLWGAAMIAGGLFLAFLGNKLLNAVIFLVTATVTIFVLGSLFF